MSKSNASIQSVILLQNLFGVYAMGEAFGFSATDEDYANEGIDGASYALISMNDGEENKKAGANKKNEDAEKDKLNKSIQQKMDSLFSGFSKEMLPDNKPKLHEGVIRCNSKEEAEKICQEIQQAYTDLGIDSEYKFDSEKNSYGLRC